jgi:guanine deaminase
MSMDERMIREAVELAARNVNERRGGPFAALVARGSEVLARAANRVTATCDPTAHAEVLAIREACRLLGSHQLAGCDVYASCEPCPMCTGAIYWARPDHVYFASTRGDAARAGFDDELIYRELALEPPRRRIDFIHVPVEGAGEPFERWSAWSDRPDY